MKKFIILTVGISLIGATILVPLSDASKEAYHSYLSQKVKTDGSYRTSTNYKGVQRRVLSRNNTVKKTSYQSRNYLIPRTGKRNIYSTKSANKNLRLRNNTNRVFGTSNTSRSHRLSIPSSSRAKLVNLSTDNYSNEIFSLYLPVKSVVKDENGVVSASIPMSSSTVTAKKLDFNCNRTFALCARSISMNLDREGEIYRSSKTFQQFQKTDSILGEIALDKEKYVEGFISTVNGKNSFVARLIINGKNGDIFLVEATSDLNDVNELVVVAKKTFQSFRAKY